MRTLHAVKPVRIIRSDYTGPYKLDQLKSLNPFALGGIVTGEQFAGRKPEIARLRELVQSGQHAFLYAPRRYGKTSLLREAFSALERSKRLVIVWCDCWPVPDAGTLASRLAQEVVLRAGKVGKFADWVRTAGSLFKRLRPMLSVGQSGAIVAIEVASTRQGTLPDLEDAVAAVGRLGAEKKRPVLLVLDEFQQIADWDNGPQAEAALRTAVQHLKGVSVLFAGSQRHLLQQMFTDRARPLFNLAAPFPLGRLTREEVGPWLTERFAQGGLSLEAAALERILDLASGHPWSTQYLAHFVWRSAAARGVRRVDADLVTAGLDEAIRVEETLAAGKLADLTSQQLQVLAALAREPTEAPTAAAYLARHRLPAKSTVSDAIRSLKTKGDAERAGRQFLVADPMLGEWLRRQFR